MCTKPALHATTKIATDPAWGSVVKDALRHFRVANHCGFVHFGASWCVSAIRQYARFESFNIMAKTNIGMQNIGTAAAENLCNANKLCCAPNLWEKCF
jgi:hypothetical protein